ncbi:MAG: TonB-dependent receptor [Bacteroidota bacterium]|nr:TonB-dependent receptor [Bacteroidota bacterium]MDX5429757.1 TonB-dependent receptor [Bacteroidota bacterium]MDX5468536.1 TonB-dependent receptor [Bacteroidota bacterium]
MKRVFSYALGAMLGLCLSGTRLQAQSVYGKVTDEKGDVLIGVSVYLEGTTSGASTDMNGIYKVDAKDSGTYTLVFSYVGFITEKESVRLNKDQSLEVNKTMKEDKQVLSETVVVGYGVQRRREVTGAVTTLKAEEINDMPAPSFEAMLQGKAPGVQVIVGSGLAGSGSVVRIRGIASLSAGGDPLYVIDGIPVTQDYFLRGNSGAMNNNPLASMNPDDIASIQILKDAAATAIYGSRGSNGVILVTTKRGKSGKLKIDFGARTGVSLPTRKPDMLSGPEFLQLYQEAWENDGNVGLAKLPGGVTWEQASKTNTNWVDQMIGVGMKQNYYLSASKGNEKFSFYSNVSYDDNGSYLLGNSYQRLSGRFNFDYNLHKNFKIGANASLSRGQNNRVNAGWAGGLGAAMSTALPIYPIKNEDGTYFTGGTNPVRVQDLFRWRTVENRAINGIFMEYYPIKNLTVRLQGSYDYMDITDRTYEPRELINSSHAGTAREYPNWINNYNTVLTANYNWKFRRIHSVNILGGTEYQRSVYRSRYTEATNMTGAFWDTEANDSFLTVFNNPKQVSAFLSYFGRVNYSYNSKLFVQLAARVDGSSRFGANYRYGFFPAISGGWIISNEDFMRKYRWVSFAKLRGSIGRNGNASIPNYQRFGTYSPPENQIKYNNEPTTYPTRLENPNLRWETSVVSDLSIELGFLKDRIQMEIGVYNKNTKDVLASLAVPKSTGFSNYWDNVGAIVNRGIEFSATFHAIDRKHFKWTIITNAARNYNKITSIGVYSEDAVSGGTNDTRVVVGSPVGTNFLVRFSHVDPQTGRPVYLDINGNPTMNWDPADRVPVGSVLPKAIGGLTNNFRFKQWEFSMLWVYTIGGNIYNSSGKRQVGVVTDWNMTPEIFDRWRQPGDQATYPRLTLQTSTYGSGTPWINTTLYLHDGTYARLRNLSVSYNAPEKFAKRLKLHGIRAQFIATNILTFTKYPGLDPEIARDFEDATDRNMSPNIVYLTPPQEMTFNIGLNLSF